MALTETQVIQIAIQGFFSVIFLYQLNIVYQDGKRDRADMLTLLRETRAEQDKIKERLYKLEVELEIEDDPPTLPLRGKHPHPPEA